MVRRLVLTIWHGTWIIATQNVLNSIRSSDRFSARYFSAHRPCSGSTRAPHAFRLQASDAITRSAQLLTRCQWTRIVTRLVNPNCYEARGSPDGAVSSRTAPDSRLPLGLLASLRGSCWFLPGPPGGQALGPQSLRVPAVSTLGFLHDRGPSNRPVRVRFLPCDVGDGSSKAATTEQSTCAHDRRFPPATAADHGLPIEPISIPPPPL
jgi:hypothetical protein